MWDNLLDNIGEKGSENGVIILDEEYKNQCRITLEKCPEYYAITCGVYGAMVHTVFCGSDYQKIYNEMQSELQCFIDTDTTEDDEIQFYQSFTRKF
ncbi:MAG: hypothetical protein K2K91_07875 [Ruminococcus sp.]|nr:hypothetical protein [Ruminococcus sp.]